MSITVIDAIVISLVVAFVMVTRRQMSFLKKQDINVAVLGKGRKSKFHRISEHSFIWLLYIWFAGIIQQIFFNSPSLPIWISRPLITWSYIRILGCLSIVQGMLFYLLALRAMGSSWRVGVDTEHPGSLITSGIYRFSRNPIMLCLNLFGIGVWLVYSTGVMLIPVAVIIASAHYQILKEESFLKQHYGRRFDDYMHRVNRYVTFRTLFHPDQSINNTVR